MTAQPVIRLPLPPFGGYTSEDLDRIPDLPPHTELIDGSLVFVSPQKLFHTLTLFLLETELRRLVPDNLRVRREMTVTLSDRQRPEPDLVVVQAETTLNARETAFVVPQDIVLAVEVVSPDSEIRDRQRKPQLYAEAGIKHFWRIEDNGQGGIVVHVYELDVATHAYALTGIYHDWLKLTVPFAIDIDLTEIERL